MDLTERTEFLSLSSEEEEEEEEKVGNSTRRVSETGTARDEPAFRVVECKTSSGGTKRVPMYTKGMEVYYKSTMAPLQGATVIDVHQDHLLEPYYTIRMVEDGREKQTA